MQLFCRRLLPPLPYSWELSFSETTASPYTQLSLTTCNLANVPKLRDGHGHLGEIGGEESYQIADSLLLDEVDEEVAKAPRADAANGRFSSLAPASNVECKKAQRSSSACDMSEPAEDSSEKAGGDDRGHAELSTPEPHAVVMRVLQPPPCLGSTVCASLRLASNHIAFVEPRAFGGLSYLRALDLSLNHLTVLALAPDACSRLTTLVLSNNHLGPGLGSIKDLDSLCHLDISLNRLSSLEGIGKLCGLRALNASGNQLSGALPAEMRSMYRLLLCNLSHNKFSAGVQVLSHLKGLSTLRLCHNNLSPATLPPLANALGSLSLRRLTLYGNPLAMHPSYPASLQHVQPALAELDHMRLPGMLLSKGSMVSGTVSRKTLGEAVDSIAKAALLQHAVFNERHRNSHDMLLETLKKQRQAAIVALSEYRAVTGKAEANFRNGVNEAKRPRDRPTDVSDGGPMAIIDRMLSARQQLLSSEKISLGRYRDALRASTLEVEASLSAVVDAP